MVRIKYPSLVRLGGGSTNNQEGVKGAVTFISLLSHWDCVGEIKWWAEDEGYRGYSGEYRESRGPDDISVREREREYMVSFSNNSSTISKNKQQFLWRQTRRNATHREHTQCCIFTMLWGLASLLKIKKNYNLNNQITLKWNYISIHMYIGVFWMKRIHKVLIEYLNLTSAGGFTHISHQCSGSLWLCAVSSHVMLLSWGKQLSAAEYFI